LTRGRVAGVVAIAALIATLLLVRQARRHASPAHTALAQPWLLVYNAVAKDALLVADPANGGTVRRPVQCLGLPRWALRVGIADDRLVVLDPDAIAPALLLVDLEALRRVADGAACDPRAVTRIPLHTRKQPYRAILAGAALYVSYFGENLVDEYQWRAGAPPEVRWRRSLSFAGRDLGLSDLAIADGKLAVAGSGFFCYGKNCPQGHFRDPRLFVVDVAAATPAPAALPAANLNAAGLYRHGDGSLWVIEVGDYAGGHSSLQRLEGGALGAELRLPTNAGAAAARTLDDAHFAVLQMSGEHVFVVDSAHRRLARVLRFDGTRFVEASATAPLPDRSAADLQDLVADVHAADRFFFVDGKGERLVQVRWDAKSQSFVVLATIALGDGRFRTSPAWAVWLR
jgi:hypothetical protein